MSANAEPIRDNRLNNYVNTISSADNSPLIYVKQSTDEGMWDWNLNTDEVYYSPKWKNMLGYEDHELENHLDTWKRILHPDDLEPVFSSVRQHVENGSDLLQAEMRLKHKDGQYRYVLGVAFKIERASGEGNNRLVGYHIDITSCKKEELYNNQSRKVLEMIARGAPASEVYIEIALLFESRYPGMRCSMLELEGNTLLHGGAPSLPKEYCEAVHGLENGPEVGSCGSSTYTGKRVLVEDIQTDPKWADIKQFALPHGMRCCWSEPVKSSSGDVLGAFGMYYNHPALPTKEESEDLAAAAMLTGLVMERDQIQKRMRQMAFTDELTGLHSRGYNNIRLSQLLDSATSAVGNFAVMYLDLDNFKSINDSLGHDIGDTHLQEMAERLRQISNDNHTISRMGGDEFCIVVERFKDRNDVKQIAQAYLNAISKPSSVANRKFTQTGSIGIALFPEDGKDLKSLRKAADIALYTAKGQGKNSYAFYTPEQSIKAEHYFKVEQLLREAIENRELSLVYQSKVNLETGKVAGVEALCRWYHPELGYVSPLEFIAIAERIGMIAALTAQVMENAFSQFVAWQACGVNIGTMAINISPSLFTEPDFVPLLERTLKKTGMRAEDVELEITEHIAQNAHESIAIIQRLKSRGFNIAVDDFGTGYSSFASLKHMNIDVLKIDKYFIDDLAEDSKTELLVESMTQMAHALGCAVVAEGVENKEQLHILQLIGCDFAQGYLLNRPTEAEHLPGVLSGLGLV